jgi:hypothetical protein
VTAMNRDLAFFVGAIALLMGVRYMIEGMAS